LKPFETSNVHIGLEATGHYGMNLKLFLENNNYSFMEFNPLLVKEFIKAQSLRRTKTDKADSLAICQKLMSVPYRSNSNQLYHIYSLKSLCRTREMLVKERSKFIVQITNTLDVTFPEFKPFFGNKLSSTALYILERYQDSSHIANMKDFDSFSKASHGRFSYAKFANLKQLAKETVGESNEFTNIQLSSFIELYKCINEKIVSLDFKISTIIKDLNPPMLSIPGIGDISAATILAEFNNISNFANAGKMLAFAGLDPGIIQSGTLSSTGRMVKHGSGHLRYTLMNSSMVVIGKCPIFYDYYLKKRSEGKSHRVALSHVCKKLVRLIYKLEKDNISFDPSLLK
jgi:transposase